MAKVHVVRRRLVVGGVMVALAAGACSDDVDDADDADSADGAGATTEAPTTSTESTSTTEAPASTTSDAPTTSTGSTSTTEAPASTTSETPATTEPADTDAPPAPTNVTCGAGAGSGEIVLEWDAPPDPDDIADVRIYIDEGSGFTRLHKYAIDSGQVRTDSARWWAVAWPVPSGEVVQMAVTVGDAAGNESGWNPIGVFYEFAAGPCTTS